MFVLDRERQREKKRRTRAFVLSLFIPGLGQLARKRIASGLFFLIAFSFLIWLIIELWRITYGMIGTFSGLFILYFFNVIDAYKGPSRLSAPCERSCPAGITIPVYISLIRDGRYRDALVTIMDRMPFPAACGRICHHPCELVCALRKKEAAIAIECLKRTAADLGQASPEKGSKPERKRSIGIIGSGPAGLSAAYFLVRKGYPVTVYEKEEEPGGLLRWAIPAFRLPKDIVSREIHNLKQFGIEIRCKVAIGKDMTFDEVRSNHDAVLIAAGTPLTRSLDVPGVDLKGVSYALEMLSNIRRGSIPPLEGTTVAVIGGGNTAFDAARTAIRNGAKKVTIFYRRNAQEMPGNMEELMMAQREGVTIEYQVAPVRLQGKKQLSGIEFARTELKPVAGESRSQVILVADSTFVAECSSALIATGQEPDLSFLPADIRQRVSDTSCIKTHHLTMETPLNGIFAAGDITGNRMNTVVDAVETGRRAAQGIDWYLRGIKGARRVLEQLASFDYPLPDTPKKTRVQGNRQEQKLIDRQRAQTSFEEVELGLSEEQARKEASRCLQCNRLL
jgi:NADPH-dependent glutamate synthase beta subunit-like oxidoreductase/TM2 domain-containing membrane protein YozV